MVQTRRFPSGTKVYSYVRFSAAGKQARGDSVRRQVELSEKWAALHGLQIDTSLRLADLGRSAYKGQHVASGGALGVFLKAVEDGRIKKGSILAVEALDRMSRQTVRVAFLQLSALVEKGIIVVTTTDGRIFDAETLDTSFSDLLLSLASMFQAWEQSALKSRRLLASHSNKRRLAVEQGKPLGAMTVSWVRLDRATGKYELIPEKAAVVRKLFSLAVDQGLGRSAVAKRLNDSKVPCISWRQEKRAVKVWHSSLVGRILRNPACIGNLVLKGGDVAEGVYPAVVPKAIWLKAQSKGRAVPAGRRGERVNLFKGIVQCSCGASMVVTNKGGDRGAALVCSRAIGGIPTPKGQRCPYRGWSLDRLEPLILHLLKRVVPWARLLPEHRGAVQGQLAELEERLATLAVERDAVKVKASRIADVIAEGAGDSSTLVARLRALEEQAVATESAWVAARDAVEQARGDLKTARESVQRQRDVFKEWEAGGLRDVESRERLAVVLRELVSFVLTPPKAGRGMATGGRGLTVFEAHNGRPHDFQVSDDLLVVSDGPDVLVNLSGKVIEVDDEPEPSPPLKRWPKSKRTKR